MNFNNIKPVFTSVCISKHGYLNKSLKHAYQHIICLTNSPSHRLNGALTRQCSQRMLQCQYQALSSTHCI